MWSFSKLRIDANQFGRRNLSNYTRVELVLKLEPLLQKDARKKQVAGGKEKVVQKSAQAPEERKTREQLAHAAGVSHDTIARGKVIQAKASEAIRMPPGCLVAASC